MNYEDESLAERAARLVKLAEMYGWEMEEITSAKGTVELNARREGWLVRTWVFASRTGTRMVNITAPAGFAFTLEARAGFKAQPSKHPGRMVNMTGKEADRFGAWMRAVKEYAAPKWLRPMTDKEKAWQPNAPKPKSARAMLKALIAAVELECVTPELLAECRQAAGITD
ncbi:MAG: hypothetical protein KGO96_12310 [Elusimicrobia bacterium]|nr:hypothetical protein [Elusimicrobiota bacterium]